MAGTLTTTAVTRAAAAADVSARSTHSALAAWHLSSLDAPCVAALWTVFFARCAGVRLPWEAPLALGLAVWMLYVLDRVSDAAWATSLQVHVAGARPPGGLLHDLEERHLFHHRHRHLFLGAVAGATPLLILSVVVLPQALSTGWLLLALPLGVYVVAVHLLRLRGVPKELLVGLFFAIAVTMPVLVTGVGASRNVGMPALAFGMVCWLNCRAIATWETGAVEGGRFVRCCVLAGAMALLLMGTGGEATWIGAALLLSSVALLWLHRGRHGLQRVHLRALADAALLTPLLLWPLLPR